MGIPEPNRAAVDNTEERSKIKESRADRRARERAEEKKKKKGYVYKKQPS